MRSWRMMTVLALLSLLPVACQRESAVWFAGDLVAAQAAAQERSTLIMIDFFTDRCRWCQKLDEETFTDDAVREQLRQLVAVRANAEQLDEDEAGVYRETIEAMKAGQELGDQPAFASFPE